MTVDTENWTISIDDGKIEKLMDAYNAACWHCIHAGFGPEGQEARNVKMALETALVAMGLLEDEQEEEEEPDERRDGSTHYDEYLEACDHAYEAWRDDGIMVSVPQYRPMEEEW